MFSTSTTHSRLLFHDFVTESKFSLPIVIPPCYFLLAVQLAFTGKAGEHVSFAGFGVRSGCSSGGSTNAGTSATSRRGGCTIYRRIRQRTNTTDRNSRRSLIKGCHFGDRQTPGRSGEVPPAVRGAVPPQTKYSSPVLPPKPKPAPQHVGAMTKKTRPSTGMTTASREIPGARTSRQTEFTNPDGTHTLRFYAGTANVRDQSSGAMVPLDLRLKPSASRLVPADSGVTTSFGTTGTDPSLATVTTGPTSVSFGVDGAAAVSGVTAPDGSSLTFNDIRPDANLRLAASSDGVKENIVLSSADAPSSWSFPLNLTGLAPSMDSASGRSRAQRRRRGGARLDSGGMDGGLQGQPSHR